MANQKTILLTVTSFALICIIACNNQINPETSEQTVSETTQTTKQSIDLNQSISSITLPFDSTKTNQLVDGKKEGLWIKHHENGQIRSEGYYKTGLKTGLHKEWSSDGFLELEGIYKNGKANGLMKWFHTEGHLAAYGNMIDNIRHGRWKIYDIEATGFSIDANFKNGKRDGLWKINHENNPDKLWKEQTWKDDKVIHEACWDVNGKAIDCEEQ